MNDTSNAVTFVILAQIWILVPYGLVFVDMKLNQLQQNHYLYLYLITLEASYLNKLQKKKSTELNHAYLHMCIYIFALNSLPITNIVCWLNYSNYPQRIHTQNLKLSKNTQTTVWHHPFSWYNSFWNVGTSRKTPVVFQLTCGWMLVFK